MPVWTHVAITPITPYLTNCANGPLSCDRNFLHAGGAALVAALPEVKLSVEEALVLRQVPESGATVDAVARDAQLPVAKTNALLVALRLKGRIRFLPGNRVASR